MTFPVTKIAHWTTLEGPQYLVVEFQSETQGVVRATTMPEAYPVGYQYETSVLASNEFFWKNHFLIKVKD